VINERNDENDTDEGNELHTFIILSAMPACCAQMLQMSHVAWSVCCAKTAELIASWFGMQTCVDLRTTYLTGSRSPTEWAV